MKGSILFNKDINIEVDVDPSAEEGAKLISAKNLVDGQEAGGGGGGSDTVIVTETDGTLDITPNQMKAALAEGKRVVMYFQNDGDAYVLLNFSTITQNTDNDIHTFVWGVIRDGGTAIIQSTPYISDGDNNPFVRDD